MGLADPGRPEQQDVGAGVEPAVAFGECGDTGAADHRHGGEVERVEGLARRQARLGEMTRGAPVGAFGDLVLEKRGQGARRRPAFGVGGLADAGPEPGDSRQAKRGEQQRQARGVGGDAHAAISRRMPASSGS